MSVIQQVGQAVSSVASDVADTAKAAVGASAKQIAKTPLDILEELLGSGPATPGSKPETAPQESASGGASMQDMALKMQQDDQFREQQHQQLHDKIQNESAAYYQQKQQAAAQQQQVKEQEENRKRFEIKQLEKRKSSDFALQAAKDASNAEKRVGAG